MTRSPRDAITPGLAAVIVLYGALLRIEGFERTYGPLQGGPSALRAQEGIAALASHLRPDTVTWSRGRYPYRFDAVSYLASAREMNYFYEARRREPAFVGLVKVGLWLTGGQDIAVSIVSGIASILLVVATLLLGAELAGPIVGLPAALLVAIDPDLVHWGTMGFRDDFFGLVTVMFAWTSLRLAKNPSPGRAVAAGVAGAVACLTRITSLAFVAPALAFVAVSLGAGERDRGLRATAIAIAVAALLLAPFLIDCWIRLGDPLFTINTHTGFYLTRGTHSRHPSVGIARFLFTRLGTDPVHAMDSLLRGLIVYPWDNKWSGLAKHWSEPLAWALKLLCAPGLVMWLWTRNGRLLLVTLVGALLPFAVTWDVFPEWRFTLHAVPFLVIAAVDFVARTVGAVRLWFDERNASRIEARARVRTIFASVGLSFALPATVFALAPVTFANELARGNPAGIAAGDRDWLFFASDWYSPRKEGDVTYRYADGREATIRVPLVRGGAFDCLVRMDPTPALVALDSADLDVEVSINGVWWQRLALRYDPQRVGQQTFRVPEGVLEPGINRLRFRAIAPATGSHRADESSAFRLWYLRVAPG